VRIRPIVRNSGLTTLQLADAFIELVERYWVVRTWRKCPPGTPPEEAEAIGNLERLTATRYGRRKYRTS
jgi:hypothetical protein